MFLSSEEIKTNEQFFKQRYVSTCEKCNGRGFVVQDNDGYEISNTCDCLKKVKRYVQLLDCGIPKKYLVSENESKLLKLGKFANDLKEYAENFQQNYQELNHLFICGLSYNTSKINSFLIKHISKLKNPDVKNKMFDVSYSLFSDIIKMSFDSEKSAQLNYMLYKSDVLFIDNVGGEFGRNDNKFSQRFLENIIRKRDNDCKLIVLISTLDTKAMESMYGKEISNFIKTNKVIDATEDINIKSFKF